MWEIFRKVAAISSRNLISYLKMKTPEMNFPGIKLNLANRVYSLLIIITLPSNKKKKSSVFFLQHIRVIMWKMSFDIIFYTTQLFYFERWTQYLRGIIFKASPESCKPFIFEISWAWVIVSRYLLASTHMWNNFKLTQNLSLSFTKLSWHFMVPLFFAKYKNCWTCDVAIFSFFFFCKLWHLSFNWIDW